MIHTQPGRPAQARRFTYLEILITVSILGVVMTPFIRTWLLGSRVTKMTREEVMASFLAVEKLEEIQGLSFELVRSDFENYRSMYLKLPTGREKGQNADIFYSDFSDVWTPKTIKKDEKLHKIFFQLYQRKYRREYLVYPKHFEKFQRYVMVKPVYDKNKTRVIKKLVTVTVKNIESHKILAEMFLVLTPS